MDGSLWQVYVRRCCLNCIVIRLHMVIAPVAGSEKGFMNDISCPGFCSCRTLCSVCSRRWMSQGLAIDIMTFNSYSFTVLQFLKRKNRFRILKTRGQVSVSWTMPIHTRRYSLTVFYKHIRKGWHAVGWHVTWGKVIILSLTYRVT